MRGLGGASFWGGRIVHSTVLIKDPLATRTGVRHSIPKDGCPDLFWE